ITALVPSAATAPISQFRAVFQSVVPAAPLKVAVVCACVVASPKAVNKAQANAREHFVTIFMMGLRILFSLTELAIPMAACFMVYVGSDVNLRFKSIFEVYPIGCLSEASDWTTDGPSFIISDI